MCEACNKVKNEPDEFEIINALEKQLADELLAKTIVKFARKFSLIVTRTRAPTTEDQYYLLREEFESHFEGLNFDAEWQLVEEEQIMTREEYEAKKKAIVAKKAALDKELDELCDSFHDEELKECKEKFEGKYVLYYERELRKTGKGPIIPTEYTIYKIDNVTFVGHGFINVEGSAYSIVNREWDCQLTKRTHDEFRKDLRISTWHEPDEFLSRDEFETRIKNVAIMMHRMLSEICAES